MQHTRTQPASRVATISLLALQRARTTLDDFVSSYCPLHGVQPHDGLSRFLDVLVYVSASLYELDEANERFCLAGDTTSEPTTTALLRAALAEHDLLDVGIAAELDAGERYWRLERNICSQLLSSQPQLSADDVMTAHSNKSFDYRVLHRVLLRLLRKPVDDALFACLRLDELLVDIGDDFTDYEDDIEKNSFNLLRCFVALHGVEHAPLRCASYISSLEAAHASALAELPDTTRALFWSRHADASSVPGSGRWAMPRLIPIASEASFRERHSDEA